MLALAIHMTFLGDLYYVCQDFISRTPVHGRCTYLGCMLLTQA